MKNYHTESQFIFRTRAAVGQRHSQFERGGGDKHKRNLQDSFSDETVYFFFPV